MQIKYADSGQRKETIDKMKVHGLKVESDNAGILTFSPGEQPKQPSVITWIKGIFRRP